MDVLSVTRTHERALARITNIIIFIRTCNAEYVDYRFSCTELVKIVSIHKYIYKRDEIFPHQKYHGQSHEQNPPFNIG